MTPQSAGATGATLDLPRLLMRLSLLTDLARDVPFETALLTSHLALDLADAAQLTAGDRRSVFYASLLRYLGCTAYSTELTAAFGLDERSLHAHFAAVDHADRAEMGAAVMAARPLVPLEHVQHVLRQGVAQSQCEVAQRSASRLALEPEVVGVLGELFERWDGHGPGGRRGDELTLPTRVLHIGYAVALPLRTGGPSAAARLLERWAGRQLDPALVELAQQRLPAWAELCAAPSLWEPLAAVAPVEQRPLDVLDELAGLLAEFADLKSAYRIGHSPQVAALAAAATRQLGLGEAAAREAHLAGMVHDVGMVAVATQVLDRAQRLSPSELERVQSHAYYTRRVLTGIPELERVAVIAGAHHERLDASGYPSGAGGNALQLVARVLAVADIARALLEARPHRPAYGVAAAGKILRAEASAGRLDAAAVEAVLAELEGRSPRGSSLFTPRQIEVLRLVLRGLTEKEIAADLTLSPRTVHHHITAIYERAGVSSRAALAMFAVENGLID